MRSKQLLNRKVFLLILIIICINQPSYKLAKTNNDVTRIPLTESVKVSITTTDSIYFFIDKSKYRLSVICLNIIIKSNKVVLGSKPKDNKLQQGNGCTPEGVFVIKAMYPDKKWSKFKWIDYPNAQSKTKFKKQLSAILFRLALIWVEI